MSGSDRNRIVSSGRRELMRTPEYAAAVSAVRERIRHDFAPRIADAGPLRGLVLRVQRWRMTRREIDALAPFGALYSSHDAFGRR